MKKSFLLSIIIAITVSCQTERRECNYNLANESDLIYNEILEELVVNGFYNHYLGEKKQILEDEYFSDNRDTVKIRKMKTKFHNEIYNTPKKYCTVFLDSIYKPEFESWDYYENDTSKYTRETKQFIMQVAENGQSAIDSLNTFQNDLKPENFNLCIANVISIKNLDTTATTCGIGIVSFSKILLNKEKNKGLINCNFKCGNMCGFGRLLLIEKYNAKWTIKESLLTWIS